MRRNSSFPILAAFLVAAIALTGRWWSTHTLPPGNNRGEEPPTESAPPNDTTPGSLTKYGIPHAHRIVGPFHVLKNVGYVSGYDSGIQDPRWVATRFFAVDHPKSAARPSEFSPDPRIEPQYQVDTHYWTRSGYDRGHMAPNWGVSTCYGRNAQIETFLLTNVVPQTPALNRGLWETLEKIISNDYAERFGEVWVITGPIFSKSPTTLRDGKVWIPDKCYKIVLRVDSNATPHVLAFEMPQDIPMDHQQSALLSYLTTVQQVETDTGVTFFDELEPEKRKGLERSKSEELW